MSDAVIQFKWTGQDVLKGYIGTAYATTVCINNMPYQYCWDGNLLRFGNKQEASAISREDLPKELSKYFITHDFTNYDASDLWGQIGTDYLVAFSSGID